MSTSQTKKPVYHRVMLKISGEALLGSQPYGIDGEMVQKVAHAIQNAYNKGVDICVVVGGGNIFRGVSKAAKGIDRATADYMGMLATVMNALALQSALEHIGVSTRVASGIDMKSVCEPYLRHRCLHHLEKRRVVIFAAGSGSPFFTTDTAAALRASEMNCDVILKATQVDGVYCSDPKKNAQAQRFTEISYTQVLADNLKVMDAAAISLARDNHIPLVIFSIHDEGSLDKVLHGEGTFTIVSDKGSI